MAYNDRTRPYVLYLIVAINVVVYFFWQAQGWSADPDRVLHFMVDNFLVSWTGLLEGRYWTLLTNVFSHNLFWHIGFNMVTLISFGSILEQLIGHRRFLTLYLVAGLVASFCHCLVSTYILNSPDMPALGASGALLGVVWVVALMFPSNKILLFFIIPVSALWGVIGFMIFDFVGIYLQYNGGGLPLGHGAHLGGSFTGILYYYFFIRPSYRKTRDENSASITGA